MKLRQSKHTSLNIGSSFRDKRRLVFAAALLGIGAAAFVCPIPRTLKQAASAETGDVTPTISLSKGGLVGLSPVAGGVASEGTITVTSATTNYTGYDLYLTSSDGKMTMLSYGSEDELAGQTIDSLTGATSASSSDFIDKWGYRVGDSGNYDAAPTTIGTTGNVVHSSAASSDVTTLGFAARVGQTKPQGAYKGSLTLTAVVNSNKAYKITYEANATSVENVPISDQEEKYTTGATITLSLDEPRRGKYDFIGWCTVSVSDNESCSGTLYDPGDTITLDATTANAITLYATWLFKPTVTFTVNDTNYGSVSSSSIISVYGAAVSINSNVVTIGSTSITATANFGYKFGSWTNNCGDTLTADCTITANFIKEKITFAKAYEHASKDQYNDYYKMQDMSSDICSAVTTPTTKTETISEQLIDSRDNKIYWVSKLLDGNCWMTQNLDYDISATSNTISNNDGTTGTWTSSSTYAPTATSSSLTSNTSYTGTASWDPGNYYVPGGGVSSACTNWTMSNCANGIAASTVSPSSSDAKNNTTLHYHIGNYYQYNAATAGTGGTITSKDAASSICPAGWRLPTSNSYTNNYSFGKLTNAYGITNSATGSTDAALIASPLFFVRGGYIYSGSLNPAGSSGFYWSSMAYSNTYGARNLLFYSSSVYPSLYGDRYGGYSVRCVAR